VEVGPLLGDKSSLASDNAILEVSGAGVGEALDDAGGDDREMGPGPSFLEHKFLIRNLQELEEIRSLGALRLTES
jgi:hypothetical protein